MALDNNEKRLVEKLVEALMLLRADKEDIYTIARTQKIDEEFLNIAGKIFEETEACDVCSHAFHSWRKTLDDDTILHFIDDWIKCKKENEDSDSKSKIVKMKKRS